MNKNITNNDLLLLAYNELDFERKCTVLDALKSNAELRATYDNMIAVMQKLDSFSMKPNNTSLQIILEESSSAMELI